MLAMYLRIEVGAGQVVPDGDPAGADVVVLPKQLQPSPPLCTQGSEPRSPGNPSPDAKACSLHEE